ncbi:MAG: methyltransferase domain-containing protein, partial [Pseudomonadales bacterium]|nr:methyltransferase domain-containing protein [Pseudomonadales bacterium]
TVTGIDPSETGVSQASVTASRNSFFVRSIDDDLSLEFGKFPLVLSLEVLEHCYSPARFMRVGSELLETNGFEVLKFYRVGRIPSLAKSMIVVARKKLDTS